MHALSSAAVALAVTRACTRGELERCGCDRKVRGVSPEGEHGSLLHEYAAGGGHARTHMLEITHRGLIQSIIHNREPFCEAA